MKKSFKIIIVPILALILIVASVLPAFAETLYTIDGYTYSVSDNISITLHDWDTSIDSNLVLPDGIANRYFTNIANWAFRDRKDITGLDFSNALHLKRIGYEAFSNCSEISSDLIIPESVNQLNERSFSGCSSIPSIVINGDLTSIPPECFYGCSSVKNLVLPDTLQSIGSWAFGGCDSLEYAEIPKSVTSIASSAFSNDPNLILRVYTDTAGHNYAVEKNMPYILLDGPKSGDVNGDGVVDILDATEIQKYAAESTDFTPEQFELGDINKDGYCDVIDALLVQKSVIGAYEIPQNIIRY